MIKIGLIVNPIAGMGGRVGLKGTDDEGTLIRAIQMGARSEAPEKTIKALRQLLPLKEQLLVFTCSGDMGENEIVKTGLDYEVVYTSDRNTTSDDTVIAASRMLEQGIDLLVFAGGDGTARDIYKAIGQKIPVIGIPAGVKIHSPVYGNTPEASGKLAAEFLSGKQVQLVNEEVIDIDEEAYRNDVVMTQLYGYLKVPVIEKWIQNKKAPTPLSDKASQMSIALDIADSMEKDVFYLIGPGSTTKALMDALSLKKTLLGVDIIKNKELVKADCSENEILEIIGDSQTKLIITPTGGQGYLLGRGNQQISPRVLSKVGKNNITIIATEGKLIQLKNNPLRVYTGDEDLDKELSGYYKVRIGYGMSRMYKVEG